MTRSSRKVFIVSGNYEYRKMWTDNGAQLVTEINEADVVQFTGGEDVYPGLYNEPTHPYTKYNEIRDAFEMDVFTYCREYGIPMVGICRGSQFLTVANGDSLWQDVNNHAIAGTHDAVDCETGKIIPVSSTHHQMMRPGDDAEILCVASESTFKETGDQERYESKRGEDIEATWYAKTGSLCFQPHPEFFDKDHPCQKYFFTLVNKFIK